MPLTTILPLLISNTFMTAAWYGHLKYKKAPLLATIIVGWTIAFFESVFQVPANRIGSNYFAFLVFREPLRWNNLVSYVLLIGAVAFAFWPH